MSPKRQASVCHSIKQNTRVSPKAIQLQTEANETTLQTFQTVVCRDYSHCDRGCACSGVRLYLLCLPRQHFMPSLLRDASSTVACTVRFHPQLFDVACTVRLLSFAQCDDDYRVL